MLKYGNFNGIYAVPVHSTDNLLVNGTYNLAGNVSEWIYNANQNLTRRWTVGGNYKEPDYQFRFPQSYDLWTRSEIIGFRCIRYINDTLRSIMEKPFFGISKGYIEEEIVSDEVFEVFRQRWDYEKQPLHPVILEEIREDTYIKQLVQFDVPYEDLPLKLIIWIPLNARPPYQSVVSWRGLGMRFQRELRFAEMEPYMEEHYLKSGRVVILPIYYSTFDRGLKVGDPMFKWELHDTYSVIDAQLTCDYIYQNDSLDNDRIAFDGFSWGALRTPFVLAMEKRYKVAVAILAGLKYYLGEEPWHYMLHYLPRVSTPILLIGGRYDAEYPPDSQEAFIKYLGTPDEDIRHIIYDTGHNHPGSEALNESLAFIDKYLGKVELKEP
jgi:dienelactone hydrolase